MKTLALASVGALIASPVLSADLSSLTPAAGPSAVTQFDWTGAFVGANVGGAWSSYNALNSLYASPGSISSAGPIGGVQAGYLYMLPSRLVFGGSAAVDWNGSGSTTTSASGPNIVSDKTSFGLGGNVVGRAGYAFGDIMPYALGGWAWQSESDLQTQLLGKGGGVFPGLSDQSSYIRKGWVLGPGLAYRFSRNWSVFGQYQYEDFWNLPINYPVMNRTNKGGLQVNVISLGLNYKF
jgi:outer membrane immunogenic protein